MFIINVSTFIHLVIFLKHAHSILLSPCAVLIIRRLSHSLSPHLIPQNIIPLSSPLATRLLAHLPWSRARLTTQAPYLFSTVWSLIKPWLDEATVRKIHILGRNYKSELQQYIAPENLPVDLGGKCRCERDGGCSLSNAGPWTTPAPAAA